MMLTLIALFALCAVITVRDVRYRLVYGADVILLIALRVLASIFSLYPEASGLQPGRWGFGALATSALAALAVTVLGHWGGWFRMFRATRLLVGEMCFFLRHAVRSSALLILISISV